MDTLAVDADDLIAQRTEEGWNGWPVDGKIDIYILKHTISGKHVTFMWNK